MRVLMQLEVPSDLPCAGTFTTIAEILAKKGLQ